MTELNDETHLSVRLQDPALYEKILRAAEDLKTRGWAVIDGLFSEEFVASNKAKLWDSLEAMSEQYKKQNRHFSRDIEDYSHYRMEELLPHKHGIVEAAHFNHCEAVREIRTNEVILHVFSTLYGNTQLLGSQDRVNFKFAGKRYASQADWDHADQQPGRNGLCSIQAYYAATGSESGEHPGNRFYDGSHLGFEAITKPYIGQYEKDWFKLTQEMVDAIDTETYPLVKPCHGPGSLVLWDSRTIHSPSDGTDFEQGRYVVYVSYLPYDPVICTPQDEKKKQAAFTGFRATTHTASPQSLFGEYPRDYGKKGFRYRSISPECLFAPTLKALPVSSNNNSVKREKALQERMKPNAVERLLFGFDSYGSAERRSKKIGLWGKRWAGGPALLTLVQDRTTVPLSAEYKAAKDAKRKANQKKKVSSSSRKSTEPDEEEQKRIGSRKTKQTTLLDSHVSHKKIRTK